MRARHTKSKKITDIVHDIHKYKSLTCNDAILECVVSECEHLEYLHLEKTSLICLPQCMSALTNLTHLVVTAIGITAVPTWISIFRHLENLCVTQNALQTLPDEILELVNLQRLRLDQNNIFALPHALGKLRNLHVLSVCYNNLQTLPQSITQIAGLEELDISDNPVLTLPCTFYKLEELNNFFFSGTPVWETIHEAGFDPDDVKKVMEWCYELGENHAYLMYAHLALGCGVVILESLAHALHWARVPE